MELPQPVTNTDFFLQAVIDKLEEIRIALTIIIDVENELQGFMRANQSTPKTVIQLDADKVGDAISKAILVGVGVKPNTKARGS